VRAGWQLYRISKRNTLLCCKVSERYIIINTCGTYLQFHVNIVRTTCEAKGLCNATNDCGLISRGNYDMAISGYDKNANRNLSTASHLCVTDETHCSD
jgi:hypothetical protein